MKCDECMHSSHIGLCESYVEIEHVEIVCPCVMATDFALDVKSLRIAAADQEKAKKELQKKEKLYAKPRPKWRRL